MSRISRLLALRRRSRRYRHVRGAGARARRGADFFKGKTVTYIVATSPGGGYDTLWPAGRGIHAAISAGLDLRGEEHAGRRPSDRHQHDLCARSRTA